MVRICDLRLLGVGDDFGPVVDFWHVKHFIAGVGLEKNMKGRCILFVPSAGCMATYMEQNFFRGSVLATWLGFTATFVARPLGGIFLGILSDAFGRKLAVMLTIVGMLSGTVGQGLLPTPRGAGDSAWGSFGLVLLFSLRLLQGLCTGGEISTVSTYIVEVSGHESKGRCVALISITVNLGFLLARSLGSIDVLFEPEV